VRAAYTVFWASPATTGRMPIEVREVPATMWAPMVILVLACLAVGLFPQAPFPLLDRAAAALATLGR